jgi:outer membrane murein-binding lipoprotein Lpp
MLSEELQKRLDQQPDQWTLAWWNERFGEVLKGYRGATHGINRALADHEDLGKSVEELRAKVKQLQADREADRARLGELQAEFEDMQGRVDRMAEFLTTLKKAKTNGGST